MGLQSLNRSFKHTQSTIDVLTQQYIQYGFTKQQILTAWTECRQNPVNFHDTLIQITTLQNQKVMTQDQLHNSQVQFKKSLQQKEEDDLNKAIMLSLENAAPSESLEELVKQLRTNQQNPTGLKNLGNTCYMNIMIQSLFNFVPFRNIIILIESEEKTLGQSMIKRLQELFTVMQQGNRLYCSPNIFFEALQKFKPNALLIKGKQNDFNELQVAFLEAIEEGLKESNVPAEQFLKQFYGQSEEIMSYTEQDGQIIKKSKTTFGSITIDAKDALLERGLRNSQLLHIDEYETSTGEKVQAKIEQNIIEAPVFLSFYINRVYYDSKQKSIVKNNNNFEFPQQLNLSLFQKKESAISEELQKLKEDEQKCMEKLRRCGEQEDELQEIFDRVIRLFKRSDKSLDELLTIDDFVICEKNTLLTASVDSQTMIVQLEQYKQSFISRRTLLRQQLESIYERKKELMKTQCSLYQLTSVLIHDGNAYSGHYYCYILRNNQWWKCNDRETYKVDYTTVYLDAIGKNRLHANVSGLVYQAVDTLQEVPIIPGENLQKYIDFDTKELLNNIDIAKRLQNQSNIVYKMNPQIFQKQ